MWMEAVITEMLGIGHWEHWTVCHNLLIDTDLRNRVYKTHIKEGKYKRGLKLD